jgi:hypothetical protein
VLGAGALSTALSLIFPLEQIESRLARYGAILESLNGHVLFVITLAAVIMLYNYGEFLVFFGRQWRDKVYGFEGFDETFSLVCCQSFPLILDEYEKVRSSEETSDALTGVSFIFAIVSLINMRQFGLLDWLGVAVVVSGGWSAPMGAANVLRKFDRRLFIYLDRRARQGPAEDIQRGA